MDVCFFNKLLHIFANMNNVLNNISKNLYLCSVCINTHTHTFSLYVICKEDIQFGISI